MLSQLSSIRKDMIILEKSEFAQLRYESEKQHAEMVQLNNKMNDEFSKTQSKYSLDINLERSRAKESVSIQVIAQLANVPVWLYNRNIFFVAVRKFGEEIRQSIVEARVATRLELGKPRQ